MASSSVSQDSIDVDDVDLSTRRSRIRCMRGRSAPGSYRNTEYHESMESGGDQREAGEDDAYDADGGCGGALVAGVLAGDQESPTRLANRLKDKRYGARPVHLYKGKTAKDKRKLREKRRSTGIVHLQPSTESTGDSLDEKETRRNTSYNEFIDADNPQTPEEERKAFATRSVLNKSPSDLEADFEDNQDYDSTVSQSESNLSAIGQPVSSGEASVSKATPTGQPQPARHRGAAGENRKLASHKEDQASRASARSAVAVQPGGAVAGAAAGRVVASLPLSAPPPRPLPVSAPSTQPSPSSQLTNGSPTSSLVQAPPRSQALRSRPGVAGGSPRARQHVQWQMSSPRADAPLTAQAKAVCGALSSSASAATTTPADILKRLADMELALNKERQERQREKEERQRLQELLMERDTVIRELRQEVSCLHQELETLDCENKALETENHSLLRAITRLKLPP